MEFSQLKRTDILRMWSQIITQTGIDKYNYAEWQENYEEFWKCVLSPSEPYIRIQSIEQLTHPNQLPAPLNKSFNPPAKPGAAKVTPAVSDTLSGLRMPRVKPDQHSALDMMSGGRANEKKNEHQPDPRLKSRFGDYRQQDQRNAQPQINHLQNEQQQQQQLQQLHQQHTWQSDLSSRTSGNDPFKHMQNDSRRKRSRDRHSQQHLPQQTYQQYASVSQQMDQPQQQYLKDKLQQQYPLPPSLMEHQGKGYPRTYHDRSRSQNRGSPNRSKPKQTSMEGHTSQTRGSLPRANDVRQQSLVGKPKTDKHSSKAARNGKDDSEQIDAASDYEMENKLIADTIKQANNIQKPDDVSPAERSPEIAFNTKEQVHQWLQSFDNKELLAVEHKIADTSDFFKNLPNLSLVGRSSQEMKSTLENVFFCEMMDEDDDRKNPQTCMQTI